MLARVAHPLVLALLLAPVLPARSVAQDTVPQQSGGVFCFRGRPKPRCSSFMLTEFAMRRPLGTVPDVDPTLEFQLGAMLNVGRRSAIGGALVFGGEESTNRRGVSLRYRRWLTDHVGAEMSLGTLSVCETTGPDTCERTRSGMVAEAGLNVSDYFAVSVAYEHLRAAGSKPGDVVVWSYPATSRWTGGVKFGSYAGPLVLLGLGILVGATWD